MTGPRQIALPLGDGAAAPARIVIGNANAAVIEGFAQAARWPFHVAILTGPPRSGKSLLARWFVSAGTGDALDDADRRDDTQVFHAWNRAQETRRPLLLVTGGIEEGGGGEGGGGWRPALPDLASRLGAALRLAIGAPDDAMLADLIALHAETRGLMLDETARAYLAARGERSHMGAERLVAAIDRLSLERKTSPSLGVWRAALDEQNLGGAPPLLP